MLPTSVFRMRIDLPRDRAASGSFFDPNSTMITTATIRIFHGLSNRSPIMSVLYQQGDVLLGQSLHGGLTRERFPAANGARLISPLCSLNLLFGARRATDGLNDIIREGGRGGRTDVGGQRGRRDDPAVLAELQGQPPHPARIRGAQHHPQAAVGQV